MKILVNFTSAKSGGALSYLRNIVPEWDNILEKDGDDREVCLVLLQSQLPMIAKPNQLRLHVVPDFASPLARIIWERAGLRRLAKQWGADVVYTPYQVAPYFSGLKNVVMIRNMEPFHFRKYRYSFKTKVRNYLLLFLSKNTLKKADHVLACSEFSLDYCTGDLGIRSERVSQVYHGRDERFTPDTGNDDKTTLEQLAVPPDFVFTAGSMLPYRKCEDVIRGFSNSKLAQSATLVIAGSGADLGYAQSIANEIEMLSDQKVLMLGQVTPDQMRVLYRNCLLFVTATQIEACPNIAIEAMSSGAKIVSSDSPPLPEMFGDSACYFSAEFGEESLAKKLNSLMPFEAVPNAEALQRAKNFSWRDCAHKTLDILSSC